MREIKIKFYGLGYDNVYQAYIKIYNSKKILIYEGTTYNNEVEVLLNMCELYKISIKTCNEELNINVYINQIKINIYLNKYIIKINHIVTFLLTDYYYDNLKIERGDLTLWPKM